MIAFFDTNIYVDYLRGVMPAQMYLRYFSVYVMRMCPVVYHELLRGICSSAVEKKVKTLGEKIVFLPPPTTKMWADAGEIISMLQPHAKEKTMEQVQNDVLIALTARYSGATLITRDADFEKLQRFLQFSFIMHPSDI